MIILHNQFYMIAAGLALYQNLMQAAANVRLIDLRHSDVGRTDLVTEHVIAAQHLAHQRNIRPLRHRNTTQTRDLLDVLKPTIQTFAAAVIIQTNRWQAAADKAK